MTSLRRLLSIAALGAAALSGLSASDGTAAATASGTTAPSVTYTASGTFASPAVSGQDLFKLAGQPFSISVVASESLKAVNNGKTWAQYTKLHMSGTVLSGLLPTPMGLSSSSASIELATGNPAYNVVAMFAPVKVVSLTVTFTAIMDLPPGTMTNDHILPFKSVTLTPSNATVVYSDGTNSTKLGLNGTLTATASGAPVTGLKLFSEGAKVVSAHADGSQTVRPVHASPLYPALESDAVTLQLYAAGVSEASQLHVQVAGQDAPVLYAGPSGHFPGVDQISVQLPRSLAGMAEADVSVSVGNGTSEWLRVHIQ